MPVQDVWYQQLAARLGVPADKQPAALGMLHAWGTLENVNPAYNNPYGIMQDGVLAKFPTPQAGQEATAALLTSKRYRGITQSLQKGKPQQAIALLVNSPWNGSGHYGARSGNPVTGYVLDYKKSSVYKTWLREGNTAPPGDYTGPGFAGGSAGLRDAASAVGDLATAPARLAGAVLNRDLWVRVAEGAAGVALIVLALIILNEKKIAGVASTVGKLAVKVPV